MKFKAEAFKRGLKETSGSLILLLFIVVLFSILDSRFLTTINLTNVLRIGAITVIAVYGQTFVLLTGQIDLSMGAVASMVSIVIATCIASFGIPLIPSLLIGLLLGLFLGFINGVLVFYFKLPSFIITFGTMTSLSGLANYITRSTPIEMIGVAGFDGIGRGFLGPIPIPIIIAVIAFLILSVVLNKTSFGRTVYAIGNNKKVAILSGRRVVLIGIATYALAGFLVAVTSIILSSRICCGHPTISPDLAFDVIAAAAIGGVSLVGGRGNLVQATIGALIVVALLNGLTLINVSTYMQMVTRGLLIITAVIINNLRDEGFTKLTGIKVCNKRAGV